jgi:membrane fusion protein (multidrug efflux system)
VSIVSQDPMYVVFPVPTRTVIELQRRSGGKVERLVIRIRLPDGSLYDTPAARLRRQFGDRQHRHHDPARRRAQSRTGRRRVLIDGELVTAILQDVEPTEALAVPRAAVLADQEGDYVFVVGKDNKAEKRRVKLGQSTPASPSITSGLAEGETWWSTASSGCGPASRVARAGRGAGPAARRHAGGRPTQ